MNRKQTIQAGLITGLVIGIGLLQYRLYKANKNKNKTVDIYEEEDSRASKSKTIHPSTEAKAITPNTVKQKSVFPLQLGSTGEEVTQLQAYLLKEYGWEEVTMGTYDKATQNRVYKYLKVSQVDKDLYKELIKIPIKLQ